MNFLSNYFVTEPDKTCATSAHRNKNTNKDYQYDYTKNDTVGNYFIDNENGHTYNNYQYKPQSEQIINSQKKKQYFCREESKLFDKTSPVVIEAHLVDTGKCSNYLGFEKSGDTIYAGTGKMDLCIKKDTLGNILDPIYSSYISDISYEPHNNTCAKADYKNIHDYDNKISYDNVSYRMSDFDPLCVRETEYKKNDMYYTFCSSGSQDGNNILDSSNMKNEECRNIARNIADKTYDEKWEKLVNHYCENNPTEDFCACTDKGAKLLIDDIYESLSESTKNILLQNPRKCILNKCLNSGYQTHAQLNQECHTQICVQDLNLESDFGGNFIMEQDCTGIENKKSEHKDPPNNTNNTNNTTDNTNNTPPPKDPTALLDLQILINEYGYKILLFLLLIITPFIFYSMSYNRRPYNRRPYNGRPYNGRPYNGRPYY